MKAEDVGPGKGLNLLLLHQLYRPSMTGMLASAFIRPFFGQISNRATKNSISVTKQIGPVLQYQIVLIS